MQEVKVKAGGGTQSSPFILIPKKYVIHGKGAYSKAELCPQSNSWKRHKQRSVEGNV